LSGGRGVAESYSWKEDAHEIEITCRVPAGSRAKDITFAATSRSISLKLNGKTLLDDERQLRGKVNIDGTFWVLSDPENTFDNREITVTVEKLLNTPRDDFEVIEFDWKGVYVNDTEEVLLREYDEPEELDVREYAAGMGVDIDNINMSMVDKSMFSTGMNLTKSSIDELTKAGLVRETTMQADGQEFEVDESGKASPFSSLGKAVSADEQAQVNKDTPKLPLIDNASPWDDAVPVRFDKQTNRTYVEQTRNFTRAAFARDKEAQEGTATVAAATDPIDALTVKRLKEILKSQGLKVTGNKKELQDRLRQRVNGLLQGKHDA